MTTLRMTKLRLGDPYDTANPLGFRAVLDADERGEMLAEGERILDEYALNAEFVPIQYGGRLGALEDAVSVMREVYRRDPCLGLGYGASSLIASVNVWQGATEPQRKEIADFLLSGRKLACAYHELAHGNDIGRADFEASPAGANLILNGRKEVIANIQRADAMVAFARTGAAGGGRGHSQILVRPDELPQDRVRYLPRYATTGMRGVQLGGIEFTDCPLPESAVLGELGHGLEVALTSFQVTRIGLPAMMTGILDTGLNVTLRHLLGRRLYGSAATDLPYLKAVLAGVFADLMACEAFSLVTGRGLSLLPKQATVHAAATKYAVSRLLIDAMNELATALGSRFYVREGETGIFQKLLRDIQPIGFGHAARAVCQMTLLPQLPLLAKRSWQKDHDVPAELFRLDAEVGPIAFDRLRISAGGQDHLMSTSLPDHFLAELKTLTELCATLPAKELLATASPASYDLTTRYATTLMASCCTQVWQHNQDVEFVGDPRWIEAVLHRLANPGGYLPDELTSFLFAELLNRHENGRDFGLRTH
uniref:Butyryl-CoA dehydrogenase n=1 Tax=uncultured bacterium esnapd2 TaxID=1366601 RepID=S5TKA6_9BACT|nr:butyryl-CoA dehydrogenase [uncultured bacterium esnapd2]